MIRIIGVKSKSVYGQRGLCCCIQDGFEGEIMVLSVVTFFQVFWFEVVSYKV